MADSDPKPPISDITGEPLPAWAVEAVEALERVERLMAEGKCIDCEADIEHAVQDGRCMYAKPCGHRIGQGDARQFTRGLLKRRGQLIKLDPAEFPAPAQKYKPSSYRRGDVANAIERRKAR